MRTHWQSAEDIAHDALVSLIEAGNADKPVRFLMKDVRFRTASAARTKMVDQQSEELDELQPHQAQKRADILFLRQVAKVVAAFSPRDQRIFELSYLLDYTSAEIAAELGLSKSLVDKTLGRVVAALREHFDVTEPPNPAQTEWEIHHDDGTRVLRGDRKTLAQALGVDHRKISRLVTGDLKSYKGWRLAA